MKKAYIAGPYRSRFGLIGIIKNIIKARRVAVYMWKQGYMAVCPHSNSALMEFKGVSEKFILTGCLELLTLCDLLVLVPGWETSSGTLAEIREALRHQIPVYIWSPSVLEPLWQNYTIEDSDRPGGIWTIRKKG